MTHTTATRRSSHRLRPLSKLTAVIVALIAGAAACSNGSADESADAVDLSSIPLTTPEGGTTNLAAYEGTPLVVNFFASWCGPCKAELPDIERVSQEFGDEITVLGISLDAAEDSWLALVEQTGITFPTVFEGQGGAMFEAVDGRSMPTTIFLDAEGQLVHTVAGLQTEDSLRDLINTELLE